MSSSDVRAGPSRDRSDGVRTTHRPWGHFRAFVANEEVSIKTITVEPGHRISLQRHRQRAELWQILDAPMDVVVGERAWRAGSGELIWVPQDSAHRIANPGGRPGRVLEIAFGEFDEDDVERIADDYVRE